MRIRHGGAHLAEERETVSQRQAVLAAVRVETFALDVFHHEIRLARRCHGPAVETRDVGMGQRGEHLALVAEAACQAALVQAALEQLDGDRPFQLGVLRQIHLAHAALAQQRDHAAVVQLVAGPEFAPGAGVVQEFEPFLKRRRVQKILRRSVRPQQGSDLPPHRFVIGTSPRQKGGLLPGGMFPGLGEGLQHAREAGRVHAGRVHDGTPSPSSSRLSQERANSQSLTTVRSDTCKTSPISRVVSPPKNFNSTTSLWRGPICARLRSAPSSASKFTRPGAAISPATSRGRLSARPAPGGGLPLGVVHQDAAHHAGRDAEEVRPALPVDLVVVHQAQVRLVDQGRGLERVVAAFAAQVAARHLAQFLVDRRQEFLRGCHAAALPGQQKPGHPVSGRRLGIGRHAEPRSRF